MLGVVRGSVRVRVLVRVRVRVRVRVYAYLAVVSRCALCVVSCSSTKISRC